MDLHPADIEPVTLSDILDLATWNRPRSDEELRTFVESHHSSLPDDISIE
jgi:hypothetical protein